MGSAMQVDVRVNGSVQVASLRYYNARGAFAATLSSLHMAVPGPLRCVIVGPTAGALDILAWRSPTEIIWICDSPPRFDEIKSALKEADDGYLVDQTSGRRLVQLRGSRSTSLLAQLGSGFAEITVGASKIGRMADVTVLACKPSEEETLLIVDRLYLEHLLGFLPPFRHLGR